MILSYLSLLWNNGGNQSGESDYNGDSKNDWNDNGGGVEMVTAVTMVLK